MSLLSLRNIHFTYGGPPLLEGIDLEIKRGERVGLLGRNGTGKSTLLKLIAGGLEPDEGDMALERGVRVARLEQHVPEGTSEKTAAEMIEEAARQSPRCGPEDWKLSQAVKRALSRLSLEGSQRFVTLSSGMKRRVLLAIALVDDPDLLLLDEPTNHLDLASITWLERFFKGYDGTLVFVTHDRVFLQTLATRIIEVERGRLFSWECDYPTFLRRKQAALSAEEGQEARFDKKLAEEERWIRSGIKARRTRNEGRVRALVEMRNERRQRRVKIGNMRMQATAAERSGRLVIEATDAAFSHGDLEIVKGFSILISRGDRIGIIGPNGSGKTTLLKLLLGDHVPSHGLVRHGTKLEVIYFDQLREQIDEDKTVVENVGEGLEMLMINGKRRHIHGYLEDFLFTPERARLPARNLSGGERNRLMLARLFKRPSNVMVLDEPTNDLDAESIDLLEELISEYSGTLLMVSHDRAFLNNLVTSTLVLEGNARVKEYDGGYDDYIRQLRAAEAAQPKADKRQRAARARPDTDKPTKLSFKEGQEADALLEEIADLEAEQERLHHGMADPGFFSQEGEAIANATRRLKDIETLLPLRYARWEELEARPR